MKKIFGTFVFVILFVFFGARVSFARTADFFEAYNSKTASDPTTTFKQGETVWLKVNVSDPSWSTNFDWFKSPMTSTPNSTNYEDDSTMALIDGSYFWVAGPKFGSQDIGSWIVDGTYSGAYIDGNGEIQMNNLPHQMLNLSVVTPEPAAMMLYGIGGVPLALAFFRRRKDTVKI